jgi:hypothetical protein
MVTADGQKKETKTPEKGIGLEQSRFAKIYWNISRRTMLSKIFLFEPCQKIILLKDQKEK